MTEQQLTGNTHLTQKEQRLQLTEALSSLNTIDKSQLDDNRKSKLEILLRFIPYIVNNPRENYLSICTYFTENFLPLIISINKTGSAVAKIDDTFVSFHRLAKEKYFRTDNLTDNDLSLLTFYDKNIGLLTDNDLWHKFYHETTLTKDFFKIDSTSIINIKNDIQETLNKKSTQLEEIGKKTESAHNDLKELNIKVQNLKQDLNFVKLSKAFTSMLREKRREKNISLLACIALATIPIAMPMLLIIAHSQFNFFTLEFKTLQELLTVQNALAFLPLATIEIISIYYFRILLQQFYNTKGQILQLKLRAAICEFIEEYGKFIEENKFADKHYFKQFESLIFSPIVANPDQIPNTLDGIEQIGKAIKSCIPK